MLRGPVPCWPGGPGWHEASRRWASCGREAVGAHAIAEPAVGGLAQVGGLFTSAGQLALESRLADLVAQRAVLADAIANVNTPGFQPAQAEAFAPTLRAAALAQLGVPSQSGGGGSMDSAGVPLSLPSAGIAPPNSAGGAGAAGGLASAAPGAVSPDGNGVGLDATMADLAQTDLDYQAVARQLQLVYQNLTTAIDAGGTLG